MLRENTFGFEAAVLEVLVEFFTVPQVVADDEVDVFELEGIEVIANLLGAGSAVEGTNRGVQCYAGASDAVDALRIEH